MDTPATIMATRCEFAVLKRVIKENSWELRSEQKLEGKRRFRRKCTSREGPVRAL